MKKVAVIGGKGNMGRRYAKILERYCDCDVLVVDTDTHETTADMQSCDGIIISVPTEVHVRTIYKNLMYGKPILCEKPITKNILKLQTLLSIEGLDLSMINQYEFLDDKTSEGHTSYNYFKTGNDSLLWDCINIMGVARSSYDIRNDSLIWTCRLNGKQISLSDMDLAYIDNIKGWVNGWRNKDYILGAHLKVAKVVGDGKNL
jgi:hypothetical protein